MTRAFVHTNLIEESGLIPSRNTQDDEGTTVSLTDSSTASHPSDDDQIIPPLSSRKRRPQIPDIVNSGENSNMAFSSNDEISIESLSNGEDLSCADIVNAPNRDTSDPLRDSKKARTGKQEKDNFSCALVFDEPTFRLNSNESKGKTTKILQASPTRSPFDPAAMKELIANVSSDALKKLPHRKGFNPVAEFILYLPNENTAMKLFEGIEPTCNTPQMTRWELSSNEDINSWLGKKDQYIHPVEGGEWFIDWFAVYNPLYAWAKFHSCEATFDQKTDRLTLTFKSELFATGKDEHGKFRSIE